jgi:hypothetical protein
MFLFLMHCASHVVGQFALVLLQEPVLPQSDPPLPGLFLLCFFPAALGLLCQEPPPLSLRIPKFLQTISLCFSSRFFFLLSQFP